MSSKAFFHSGGGLLALVVLVAQADPARGQTLGPDFADLFTIHVLGPMPGLAPPQGGLIFKRGDPNTLVIGMSANNPGGSIQQVSVVRDALGHITGFADGRLPYTEGLYNDAGFTYASNGAFLFSRYPLNQIGVSDPGSTTMDQVIDLTPLGVAPSTGGLLFVPNRQPGQRRLKATSFNTDGWYDLEYLIETTGSVTITGASLRAQVSGGPEAFVYVPSCARGFLDPSILLCEFNAGAIGAYRVDANGDPILASRRVFIDGLIGAEGCTIDPLTGDFLFGTFILGDRIVRVEGLPPPAHCPCDWNGFDCLTSQDFFDYLTDFFTGNADFNEDGVTTSQDFFDFLACFFDGC